MLTVSILKLTVGDRVRTPNYSRVGVVTGFHRDRVAIDWDGGSGSAMTDAELAANEIMKCSPFDDNAEDTRPE